MVERYFYSLIILILQDSLVRILELLRDRGVEDVRIRPLQALLPQDGVDNSARFRVLLIGELVHVTALFQIVAHHELSQFEDGITKLCFLLLKLFDLLKIRLNRLNQLVLSLSIFGVKPAFLCALLDGLTLLADI